MKIHEIHLTPDRCFDGAYRVTAYVDEYPGVIRKPIADIDGDIFHYGETDDGAVAFGISHSESYFGHKPGYMWSSRASVFNGYFDKMCIEVIYKKPNDNSGIWGAITIPTLLKHLNSKYEIATCRDEDGEVMYLVFRRGTVPEKLDRWDIIETFVPHHNDGLVARHCYMVYFTDAYGRDHGAISDELATYEEAVEFIQYQTDEMTKKDKWTFLDGHDLYEIVPCIDF